MNQAHTQNSYGKIRERTLSSGRHQYVSERYPSFQHKGRTSFNIHDLQAEGGIEHGFNAMKNEMENDKTYLRRDESVREYFFISFLYLYFYYNIFVIMKAADLTEEFFMKDALLWHSRVYMTDDGGREIMIKVPTSVEKLDKMAGTNIFPK